MKMKAIWQQQWHNGQLHLFIRRARHGRGAGCAGVRRDLSALSYHSALRRRRGIAARWRVALRAPRTAHRTRMRCTNGAGSK